MQCASTRRNAQTDGMLSSSSTCCKLTAFCRASIFESIPLPSFSAVRFSNKRNSIATVSSQGDDYPATADVSSAGSPYSPGSEFGLPRDPFCKYTPPLDTKPSRTHEYQDRSLGAIEEVQNSLPVRFSLSYTIPLVNHLIAGG